MPQFDIAVFIPQIFWLLISFGILYYFMSNVFLPRLRAIISERENYLKENNQAASDLNSQIDKLKQKCEALNEKSRNIYKDQIEDSAKKISALRDQKVSEAKQQIENKFVDLNSKIDEFVKNSRKDVDVLGDKLAKLILEKVI